MALRVLQSRDNDPVTGQSLRQLHATGGAKTQFMIIAVPSWSYVANRMNRVSDTSFENTRFIVWEQANATCDKKAESGSSAAPGSALILTFGLLTVLL
jgi:hypothetical protein